MLARLRFPRKRVRLQEQKSRYPNTKFDLEIIDSVRDKISGYLTDAKYQSFLELLFNRVKSFFYVVPYVHPLSDEIQHQTQTSPTYSFLWNEIELALIDQLKESNRFYILDEHQSILEKFYLAKQSEDTPLGNLYKQLTFSQFLHRLIAKKFPAIYSDGTLLVTRSPDHAFSHALKKVRGDEWHTRKLLMQIGRADDVSFYQDYLSLEEAALSPLIVPNAYFLPLSDGRRSQPSPILDIWHFQEGNLSDEWENVHPYPIAISYIAGPEFRNCRSLQYDALACVRFENLTCEFSKRQTVAKQQPGFVEVIADIYGNDNALFNQASNYDELLQFDDANFGKGIFFKNAYKNRLKLNLLQFLKIADLSLEDKGTVSIKGLGLGAFGIQSLTYSMEKIFVETLEEVLNENFFPKIETINLVNFPSVINSLPGNAEDKEYMLLIGCKLGTRKILSHGFEITINTTIGPPLAKQSGLYFATHVNGDSLSFPGNELHADVQPKASSDDSTLGFSLQEFFCMIKDIIAQLEHVLSKTYIVKSSSLIGNTSTLFQPPKKLEEKVFHQPQVSTPYKSLRRE